MAGTQHGPQTGKSPIGESMAEPFFGAIVSDEGAICRIFSLGNREDLERTRLKVIQFWDEEETPLVQPYDTPTAWLDEGGPEPTPGWWIVDILNPPPQLSLVEFPIVFDATWETQWNAYYLDYTRKIWLPDKQTVEARPGHTIGRRGECSPDAAADVEVSHIVRGGIPAYKMREGSTKVEADIPDLLFTQVERYRRAPVDPVALVQAREQTHQWLQKGKP